MPSLLWDEMSYHKTIEQKFDQWHRIDASGCWLWFGPQRAGYGRLPMQHAYKTKMHTAHIVAYERFRGPVPAGHQLDHLCRVKHCVNPGHLEAVLLAENVRRSVPYRTYNRTHCPNGHEYGVGDDNGLRTRGHRRCVICREATLLRNNAKMNVKRRAHGYAYQAR